MTRDVSDEEWVPDVAGIRDEVREDLVTFVRALRKAGVDVPANASVVAARALVEVGFEDETQARAALRAVLVRRPEDIDRFDRMFGEFWRRLTARLSPDPTETSGLVEDESERPDGHLAPLGAEESIESESGPGEDGEGGSTLDAQTTTSGVAPGTVEEESEAVATATYSPAGRPERVTVTLGHQPDDDLLASVGRFTRALATERGRRWQSASAGEKADVRRSLRQSVSAGGAIVSVPERERRQTASRILVLADVSRSVLDVLDRAFLLRWLGALEGESRACRIFLFDDEIVEATSAFEAESAREALATLRDVETSWGGGTRIGHAVTTIREEHADAVDRRTAVLIVSDGLEMGDVSALERGMAWLSRRAATVLWLNPLAAAPDYEPVADGMAAALPAVDGLFAFTGPEDVDELTRQLTRQTGAIGYEHDPRRVRAGRETAPDGSGRPARDHPPGTDRTQE